MARRRKNEDRPVLISIKGESAGPVGLPDESAGEAVEFMTGGSMSCLDGICKISYRESELTGLEGTETVVSVEKNRVVVVRSGYVSSQMIFEKGQRHMSLYETPMGSFTVGVNAISVETDMGENGGSLLVNYSIEIDNALAGYNAFTITVKPSGEDPREARELVQ